MSWLLLAVAALLPWIGVDLLALSRNSAAPPRAETDKTIFGSPPPQLSDAARRYAEQRFLVRGGASTRVLGTLFVLLGIVCLVVGIGWWQ